MTLSQQIDNIKQDFELGYINFDTAITLIRETLKTNVKSGVKEELLKTDKIYVIDSTEKPIKVYLEGDNNESISSL